MFMKKLKMLFGLLLGTMILTSCSSEFELYKGVLSNSDITN